jgi:hypothetical protein
MRRNAESLLVLAGIEPPRQWAAPVRLTDVIRAALGEVEDYQRVTVRGVEPATILGSAAADLAHLLAELIENALVFSPPDQAVDIRGRNRPDGYTLAIIDSGLGMPAGDVSAANRRLAGAESFTIAPSKYLGHYVAGNLAARHEIRVHLDNSPGNGITATIDIPPTLLTSDHELAAPVTPPHGTRAITTGETPVVRTDPLAALSTPPPAIGGPQPTGPVPAAPAASPWAAVADAPAFGMPGPADAPSAPAASIPPAPALDTHDAGTMRAAPGPNAGGPVQLGPAEAPTSRTASGLVKRAPRGGSGAPLGAVPDDAQLATMSQVAGDFGNLGAVTPPSAREPIGPTWPRTTPRPPDTGGDRPAVTNRTWPAPPPYGDPPGNGQTPPSGGDTPPPALPSRHADAPPPDAAQGGSTASGLARRVRGAQLPVSQPLSVRRSQERPSEGDAGYRRDDREDNTGQLLGNGNTNGHTNGGGSGVASDPFLARGGNGDHDESSAARTVYGFLTSFTQGVQRGLEEARRGPDTPKENQ